MITKIKQFINYSWTKVSGCNFVMSLLTLIISFHTSTMASEEEQHLYGDPEKVIQYMDYSENPVQDNSRYIPDLVPGILQSLEVIEEDPALDSILSNLNVKALVKESEAMMKNVDNQVQQQMSCFPEPSKTEAMEEYSRKKFAPSTCKKALWANRMFEQWKCICNFKIKKDGQNLDNMINGSLISLDVAELNKVLSLFIMEIHKQNE